MRDGTVLGRTASTCGRAAVQSFRHGARALNLEACPELRMDAIGAIEDDAAIAATRPTSKLGGCEGSVSIISDSAMVLVASGATFLGGLSLSIS